MSVSPGTLQVTSRALLSSSRFLSKYFLPTLPKQYIATLTKRFNSPPGALSKCLSSPSTVRQSKLQSGPELLAAQLPSPLQMRISRRNASPHMDSTAGPGVGHSPAAASRGLRRGAAAAGAWCQLRAISGAARPRQPLAHLHFGLRAEHAGDPVVGGRRGQQVGRPGGGVRAPGASFE